MAEGEKMVKWLKIGIINIIIFKNKKCNIKSQNFILDLSSMNPSNENKM
jgi:hypothetical protein